jgi:DNA excision repair protein ERCC-3
VNQWEDQFLRYSTLPRSSIVKLTSKVKTPLLDRSKGMLLLTTYTMIASGGRAAASGALMREIASREWGLQILDEVHQAVASKFKRALGLRCHCRLGLTATLVREDGRDRDLSHLLGPKLYEANWKDLTLAGYLANVQCVEVWCPMAPEFYAEYLRARNTNVKKALAVLNPVKCWAMDYLIRFHEARGDKIIIFSESVFALVFYAKAYRSVVITGSTPARDREAFIGAFKAEGGAVNKLFLSRVGDVALDVPDANVIIQISSHFGSRLQEAQRMGRILRRSTRASAASGNNSYFYSLISGDTLEVWFSNKRRRYLVDQGYSYRVVEAVPTFAPTMDALRSGAGLLQSRADQNQVLVQAINYNEVEKLESREAGFLAEYEAGAESGHAAALRADADTQRAEQRTVAVAAQRDAEAALAHTGPTAAPKLKLKLRTAQAPHAAAAAAALDHALDAAAVSGGGGGSSS